MDSSIELSSDEMILSSLDNPGDKNLDFSNFALLLLVLVLLRLLLLSCY